MHFWISRGRIVIQLVQKCTCPENVTSAQHIVFTRKYTVNSLLGSKNSDVCKPTHQTYTVNQFPISLPLFPNLKKYSTMSDKSKEVKEVLPELSKTDKLKQAVKDYGATVIIFHVSISLMSLGISYLIISRYV